MIILVDMDGTIADFNGGIEAIWEREFLPSFGHKFRAGDLIQFEIVEAFPKELQEIVRGIYLRKGFYENLLPLPGAMQALNQIRATGIEVFICTSPVTFYEHCVVEKYRWVEKYLGREFVKRIVLTKDKTLVHGDILIDDKPEIKGVMKPSWRHVLFDAPYNRTIDKPRVILWHRWQLEILSQYT